MPKENRKVFIAGHNGLVGSAFLRHLKLTAGDEIITMPKCDLDLLNQNDVKQFFYEYKIDEVILAAARVGGIKANTSHPADFIYENLQIQCNIIHSAFKAGVKRLLFLGSSCIYPRLSPQPMREEFLLEGKPEPTNDAYAIAKIAGIKMCEAYNKQFNLDYRALMPTNLYGPYDNFQAEVAHVIPGMLARMAEAKQNGEQIFKVWGTGTPRREFMYVDDFVSAAMLIFRLPKIRYKKLLGNDTFVNVGSGEEVTIKELATKLKDLIGYSGKLEFSDFTLDGSPRKSLDSSKLISLGWKPSISLDHGLRLTLEYFESLAKPDAIHLRPR